MIANNHEAKVKLEAIGKIVAEIRETLIEKAVPGANIAVLDAIAKDMLAANGAESAPIHDYEFPGYTCISLNEVVAHGIPKDRIIQEGDIVNIDVSAVKDGYYADTGATRIAGTPASPRHTALLACSRAALEAGIAAAVPGNRIYHIGEAIYKVAVSDGFTVIRNLTGHGIGKALHDRPHQISNYLVKKENQMIKVGHVLAIETFVSLGDEWVDERFNGWELYTSPKNRTAQFEHTVLVSAEGPIILT
ncbi:type I methionyl aminopeptidase [Fusibacter paucivorans]|uniref:Methionine aminopeptidase n=1 Tax=Fusibacter paucivorans TaxID=76009 RepID=A0ABS5PR41_9FIRM|nr:type I methionyl aminopeptidase [Fusibacter paucivorans]MBS7527362.1 type I methionyl aminopeptidase [Fusibacter paucivorans]